VSFDGQSDLRSRRLKIGNLTVDNADMPTVIARLKAHLSSSARALLVVSPNLTNVAILEKNSSVQAAYQRADLILADGWPIQLAAIINRQPTPPLVPGSELLPRWLVKLDKPTRFLIIGGKNGLAISQALLKTNPMVTNASFDDGTWGVTPADIKRLKDLITNTRPDVLLLLLGSPKQEMLALSAIDGGFTGVILCIGAAGDFLAGIPRRAPELVRKAKLEWVYRVVKEPTRLGPRYFSSLVPFIRAVRKQS
jgi:N-acetylglucosaminyldiphosphoundecaprenol N-acetyl-beta-D-mannosaminyltransferase